LAAFLTPTRDSRIAPGETKLEARRHPTPFPGEAPPNGLRPRLGETGSVI